MDNNYENNPYENMNYGNLPSYPQHTSEYEWGRESEPLKVQYTEPAPQKPKKEKGKTPVALILVLSVLLSTVFGSGSAFLTYKLLDGTNEPDKVIADNTPQGSQNAETTLSGGKLTTEQVVEKTADSVVEIVTESVSMGFFQEYVTPGAGSGVIIDAGGLIVTNNHVIEGVSKITVTLRNGESYPAELVGRDEKTDLALIKIEADNLTVATFGNSDNLKIGEKMIAIGNPLGRLGGTVTEGILSALNRNVVVDGQTRNLLQTDTAINPGNSGGGLFDSKGYLVGIVSAKSTGSEVEGLGYAIPINDVVEVIGDLSEYGFVRGRVDIGMEFIDVDDSRTAWMYNLSELGCYVYSVDRDSNAYEAGLRSGDLVLAINSKEIETSSDIEEVVSSKNVGDKLMFTVSRDGEKKTITMTLQEEIPEDDSSASGGSAVEWGNFGSLIN